MNILFPIVKGSEIRQFYHSGVIEHLINQNHNIFIYSQDINTIKKEINPVSKVHFLEGLRYNLPSKSKLSYIKLLLDYNYNNNNKIWKYKEDVKYSRLKTILLKTFNLFLNIRLFNKALSKIESVLKKQYTDSGWKNLLLSNKIDLIIFNIPDTSHNLALTANNLNIPIYVAYHTNKDVYALGRLYCKYDKIGVWSSKMRELLVEKYNFIKEDVKIIGCSHFAYLNEEKNILSKDEFENKFKCDTSSPIILYTAAAPWVVTNEFKYVMDVYKILQKHYSKFKLIVRVNPMDIKENWESLASSDIYINFPEWHWNPKKNFNVTPKKDLVFFASLLKYSSVCINIPSSVTIEANMVGLPVINLGYQSEEIKFMNNGNILDYWNAPFYEEAERYKGAKLIKDLNELEDTILDFIERPIRHQNTDYLNSILGEDYNNLLHHTLNFISKSDK